MATGRPTKCTPEVIALIADKLESGIYADSAAILAGISEKTYYNWLERGENGVEPYATFLQATKDATAKAEQGALTTVRAAGPGWQANAWFLERRFPAKYSKRDPDHALKTKTLELQVRELEAKIKLLEAGKDPDARQVTVVIPDAVRRDGE